VSQVLGYLLLAAVAAYATYQQVCLLRIERVRRQRQLERLRQSDDRIAFLRRVPDPQTPPSSTNGHQLQLVVDNRHREGTTYAR
jgi:hypothetical protein